jgi:hypothetical protein
VSLEFATKGSCTNTNANRLHLQMILSTANSRRALISKALQGAPVLLVALPASPIL